MRLCENCKWFVKDPDGTYDGFCYCYPPRPGYIKHRNGFAQIIAERPVVRRSDFCSKWAAVIAPREPSV
jgi:hypothetical protein